MLIPDPGTEWEDAAAVMYPYLATPLTYSTSDDETSTDLSAFADVTSEDQSANSTPIIPPTQFADAAAQILSNWDDTNGTTSGRSTRQPRPSSFQTWLWAAAKQRAA